MPLQARARADRRGVIEDGHHAVAQGLDLGAPMDRERASHLGEVAVAQLVGGRRTDAAQQRGRPHHIGEEDGDDPGSRHPSIMTPRDLLNHRADTRLPQGQH